MNILREYHENCREILNKQRDSYTVGQVSKGQFKTSNETTQIGNLQHITIKASVENIWENINRKPDDLMIKWFKDLYFTFTTSTFEGMQREVEFKMKISHYLGCTIQLYITLCWWMRTSWAFFFEICDANNQQQPLHDLQVVTTSARCAELMCFTVHLSGMIGHLSLIPISKPEQ